MNLFATITSTMLLAATTAMAQTPGDPQGFRQDFDFIAAWGVDRGPDAAMALIPNDDCLPNDATGLCARYEVGASFVSEGGVSPSFEASGVIRDLTIWELPAEYAQWSGGLEGFQATDGSHPFTGEARVGDAYFAGWLATPTGYEEFVTGIMTVVRFDFESPERITVGSMILEPLDEWEFAADGFAAIDALVASVWNDAEVLGSPSEAPGEDECLKKYLREKAACHLNHAACLEDADIDLELCLDNIGFYDRLEGAAVGGAAGGAGGAGIGAGVGTVVGTPGAGTVAGAAIGGAIGGFFGSVVGFFEGPSHAKDECYNQRKATGKKCSNQHDRCLDAAHDRYLECRHGDD